MELPRALNRFLAENVKGVSIDAQAVLAHVIRPPGFDSASADREAEQSTVLFEPGPVPGPEPRFLDVRAFQVALDNAR